MSSDNGKFSWEQRVVESNLHPTTRHLLLTLAVRMDKRGAGCFPSTEQIAEMTGLSKRSVITHRQKAVDAGWLKVEEMGFRGSKWRRLSYVAATPGTTTSGILLDDGEVLEGVEEHGNVVQHLHHDEEKGGANGSPRVVQHLHQLEDKTNNQTTLERERADARTPEGGEGDQPDISTSGGTTSRSPVAPDQGPTAPAFANFKRKWPFKVSGSWPKAKKAWEGLSAEDRQGAIDGIDPYRAQLKREGQTHGRAASTYLNEALWKEVAEALEADPLPYAPPSAKPSSPLWWAMVIEHLRRGDAWRAVCSLRGLETHELVSLRFGQERDAELVAMADQFDRVATHHDQWRRWKAWMTERILANPKREGRLAMLVRNGRVPWLDALPVSADNPYWLSMPGEALCGTLEIELPDVDATSDVRAKPESEEDRVAFAQAVLAKARAAQQPDAKPPNDDETAWT